MIKLLLGTNLGDREWNLERAEALLAEALKCDFDCSPVMETKAVGFDGEDFLNQVVAFEKPAFLDGPLELLDICQSVEIEMGRAPHTARYDDAGERIYENRIIDIDILYFDDLQLDTPRLTLPHPQVVSRGFVKELLNSL